MDMKVDFIWLPIDRVALLMNKNLKTIRRMVDAGKLTALIAGNSEEVDLISQGAAQTERREVIADELHISVRTVEVHRAKVFSKLGVRSAAEVATLLAQIR